MLINAWIPQSICSYLGLETLCQPHFCSDVDESNVQFDTTRQTLMCYASIDSLYKS